MPTFSAPLLGAHFCPPAKAILQSLPASYPLELRPEPSNPYDPNAVAVWFDAKFLDPNAIEELTSTLPGMGSDIESLRDQRFWHIGYMAREYAAEHQADIAAILEGHNIDAEASGLGILWTGYPAKLTFSGTGQTLVTFNI